MSDKPCMRCAYGEYFTDCDQELLLRAEKSEKRIAELETLREQNRKMAEWIAELEAIIIKMHEL